MVQPFSLEERASVIPDAGKAVEPETSAALGPPGHGSSLRFGRDDTQRQLSTLELD
ncbi:MAG: hypothetical protein U1E30_13605 [Rhodoblastus sp.]